MELRRQRPPSRRVTRCPSRRVRRRVTTKRHSRLLLFLRLLLLQLHSTCLSARHTSADVGIRQHTVPASYLKCIITHLTNASYYLRKPTHTHTHSHTHTHTHTHTPSASRLHSCVWHPSRLSAVSWHPSRVSADIRLVFLRHPSRLSAVS
jgi:hypothetical protein